ncbi:hypothetical protein BDQ17DRAFT_1433185 [Cyathus striatus]|nr:hypothetical protein BDQ17DRAFT_1433185 [Cyathus striatus]
MESKCSQCHLARKELQSSLLMDKIAKDMVWTLLSSRAEIAFPLVSKAFDSPTCSEFRGRSVGEEIRLTSAAITQHLKDLRTWTPQNRTIRVLHLACCEYSNCQSPATTCHSLAELSACFSPEEFAFLPCRTSNSRAFSGFCNGQFGEDKEQLLIICISACQDIRSEKEYVAAIASHLLNLLRTVNNSSTFTLPHPGTQTDADGHAPLPVDHKHDASSIPELEQSTYTGTHMFSHSHEVSIQGGTLSNVGRDSVALSNNNNTIYHSCSHIADNRFCTAYHPVPAHLSFRQCDCTAATASPKTSSFGQEPLSAKPSLLDLANEPSSAPATSCFCACNHANEGQDPVLNDTNIPVDAVHNHCGNDLAEQSLGPEELLTEPSYYPELEVREIPDPVSKPLDLLQPAAVPTRDCPSNEEIHHTISLLPPTLKSIFVKIISFIMYALDDLPLSAIASLLSPNNPPALCDVLLMVVPIASIPGDNEYLGFAHPSLRHFFGDRSCAGEFFVSFVKEHETLLQCCTEYMKGLSLGPHDVEFINERAIDYACRFWEMHKKSLNRLAKL